MVRKNIYKIDKDWWFRLNFYLSQKILTFKKYNKKKSNTIPVWSKMRIELQSDCNRDCVFCPRYEDRSGVRKDTDGKHIKKSMPTPKVFDVIDQAARIGYKGPVGFHRLSEPFLDPRYLEFAVYAQERGMKIEEDTNGDVLKKNLSLCKKLDGIINLLHVGLYDYRSNAEKLNQMRFWKNRFKKTKVTFSFAAEFPLVRKNSRLYSNGKEISNKRIYYPCFWPMHGFMIRYDGAVSLCCEDDQCSFNLGNVFNSSLKDIWWSKNHIEIANTLKWSGGRNQYPLCRECEFSGFLSFKVLNKILLF